MNPLRPGAWNVFVPLLLRSDGTHLSHRMSCEEEPEAKDSWRISWRPWKDAFYKRAERHKYSSRTSKQQNRHPDHRLQKLDNDFIDNCITFLFYTYFINDTGFYILLFFANITASCRLERDKKKR